MSVLQGTTFVERQWHSAGTHENPLDDHGACGPQSLQNKMKPTLERRLKLPTLKPMGDLIWRKCMLPAAICLFHDGLQRACHAKAVLYPT